MFPAFQACEKARKLRPQLRLLRNWATLRLPAPGATWQKWFFNGDLMGFDGVLMGFKGLHGYGTWTIFR